MIMKYELEKLIKNKNFFGTTIALLLVMLGIFFIGFYYSQLSLSDKSNEAKGYPELYSEVSSKHTGEFNDQKVREILTDYINRYQSDSVEKRPFDLFSWDIADVFFPQDKDTYIQMNTEIERGKKVTLDQINISTVKEVGFTSFSAPLKIGSYHTWNDLFNVTNNLFILTSLFTILICSTVFSSEVSSNINQLLLSTKYGRSKLIVAKLFTATGISILVFLIIQLISLFVFYTYYGMSGWDASIQTNFHLKLFSFPMEINNLQVYSLVLGFQMVNLFAIAGITLLISSFTKSTFGSLVISLGAFFLPLALTYIFKTGFVNKLLYLFPINNYNVEEILTVMPELVPLPKTLFLQCVLC